jgi:lipoate-protein ligase B
VHSIVIPASHDFAEQNHHLAGIQVFNVPEPNQILPKVMAMNIQQQDKAYGLELGLIDYTSAHDLQLKILEAKISGRLDQDLFMLLEHPPVFTLGRRGGLDHLKVPQAFLTSQGIEIVPVERGGDITYHGPGQLIIYPIVNLKVGHWRVVSFVEALEELMIRLARDWGIQAERRTRNRGIWVGANKLGSLGIAVRRSISFHGLALNINTDLESFQWIDPCGLNGVSVTSLKKLCALEIPMAEIYDRSRYHLEAIFKKQLQTITLAALEKIIAIPASDPCSLFEDLKA